MISGEFDLSVGSVFALVPMTMVQLVHQGMPPWVAIALGLSIGIAVGFVNGFITLRFGIPSFIATLGMLYIARSLTTVATGGFPPLSLMNYQTNYLFFNLKFSELHYFGC